MRTNWENRTELTSVVSVDQLDDDHVAIIRRIEHYQQILDPTYERIILNR